MDGVDLFKKLRKGTKFNFQRFRKDAEKLKIIGKPKDEVYKGNLDFFGDKLSNPDGEDSADAKSPSSKKRKVLESLSTGKSDDESGTDKDEISEQGDNDNLGSVSEESDNELMLLGNIKSSGNNDMKKAEKRKKKKLNLTPKEKESLMKQEKINHCRNQHKIHCYGTDIPDPVVSFNELASAYKVHSKIIDNIKQLGYEKPTPIQMQAVPVMMMQREILACAPTGSGKTAAFLIPILHQLEGPRNVGFRALILSPTRELAQQTYRECCRLAEGRNFRVDFVEKATEKMIKRLSSKAGMKIDILVTTPNRLVYLLRQDPPAIRLNRVEWLIVDESDKLFEEGKTGFRDQLAEIYKACDSPNIRRGMFSATFANDVEEWCKLNLDNLVSVHIGARNSATETIEQQLLFVGCESGKLIAMRDIIREGLAPPVLIFVQSKDRAKELFHELIYDGINVDVIHAGRTQQQRENIVRCFRSGKIWVLICTDLMGRGMDFKGVNLVINYDFPTSAISYIHRIGRTGRAGRSGKAITFFTENDGVNLRSIANVMREAGCPIPDYMVNLRRPPRKERKKIEKSAPKREGITTIPLYDRQKLNWKKKSIKHMKKQKLLQDGDNVKDKRVPKP